MSETTEVATAARVDAWRTTPPEPADLDALCRQIDVRHRISAAYGPGWQKVQAETPAEVATVAGVVTVLLTAAAPGPDGADDGGRGLKYINSALKALELGTDLPDAIPEAARLRAWALRLLDDRTRSDA